MVASAFFSGQFLDGREQGGLELFLAWTVSAGWFSARKLRVPGSVFLLPSRFHCLALRELLRVFATFGLKFLRHHQQFFFLNFSSAVLHPRGRIAQSCFSLSPSAPLLLSSGRLGCFRVHLLHAADLHVELSVLCMDCYRVKPVSFLSYQIKKLEVFLC
jgi:hypothetical protein